MTLLERGWKVDTKIVFNGKQFANTYELEKDLKQLDPDKLKFTGSLVFNAGLRMYVFKCVNLKEVKYYINEYNKITKTSEVKFEFQTDAITTTTI
jgi:hypothetical protein